MTDHYLTEVISPRGNKAHIAIRDQTSDMSLVLGSFSNQFHEGDDEYNLADLSVDGVFVDIGSHIGIISLAVLLDNPSARAILVEPLPENMTMARRTMMENGLDSRVTFVTASVGIADIRYGGDGVDDRYVGNIGTHDGHTITAELVTLPQLVTMAGGYIAALKTDCEGGEWGLLDADLSAVGTIFGEWHGDGDKYNGPKRLRALLRKTHKVKMLTDVGGIGLFRAVPR